MKNKQNLHTHTTYCDGKDTPAQMVALAKKKSFDSLGFSGHSYMFYSPDHSMSPAGTEQYKAEITALKEQYRGQLPIFLGLEVDMYSQIDLGGYDYLLGACHYLKLGDAYVGFDRSAAISPSRWRSTQATSSPSPWVSWWRGPRPFCSRRCCFAAYIRSSSNT